MLSELFLKDVLTMFMSYYNKVLLLYKLGSDAAAAWYTSQIKFNIEVNNLMKYLTMFIYS